MTEPALLAQEIRNRYDSLPPEERRDTIAAWTRVVVAVTREMMLHSPDSVDEFLAFEFASSRRAH